jgi:3-phenylpropionate/trans-cinnamate dioxygenase ferredoxin reductase subunit
MTGPEAIVIVGSGQSGFQVAASLRANGDRRPVILIGEEPSAPYQRPPLSKNYLDGTRDRRALNLRAESFYAQQGIELLSGRRAVGIDREAGRVWFDNGNSIAYAHLVLATGARNRHLAVPGAGLSGVHQLRSVEDADQLAHGLATARTAVVIGAGFIGLEFAAFAAARGIDVTVIEATDRPMARSVSMEMSRLCWAAHVRAGVKFELNTLVRCLRGEQGRITAVETDTGQTMAADIVLVGIGVVPNVELAASCGLAVDDGVVVDQYLATSDVSISAVGDCARFPSRFAEGRNVRVECVQNAVDQAKVVAARLMGKVGPYASVPWFWSDQGSLKLQIAGLATPHDSSVCKTDGAGATVFCFRNDSLVGVETLGRPADHIAARKLLAMKLTLRRRDIEAVDFDLRSYVAGNNG